MTMNTIAWLVLLIVGLCCTFAVIVLSKRNAGGKESASADIAAEAADEDTSIPAEETAWEPPANTAVIYEYHPSTTKRLGPICDGENNASADRCRICGGTLK